MKGGDKLDYESCLCFVSSPYEKREHPEVKDNRRRFFMYMGIAKEMGVEGRGQRQGVS